MCGIIISSLEVPNCCYKYINNRGPDATNV